MGKEAVSTAQVLVNNTVVPIVPNTLTFNDGFGEYKVRSASSGKGQSEVVVSENAEMKIGKVKFEVFNTAENIEIIRQWKAAFMSNAVEVLSADFQRTFTNAVLVNDVEVKIGADATIALEWESDPAS